MSLDVYLVMPGSGMGNKRAAIYVRKEGAIIEVTAQEWEAMHPGRAPATAVVEDSDEVYTANITHNLNRMAKAAGIYMHLWKPEEIGVVHARELVDPLTVGLLKLTENPEYYRKFNPENLWGNYDGLVTFVSEYIVACRNWPAALVRVSR